MGPTDDYTIIRLVLSYRTEDGGSSSVTVAMPTLYEIAAGDRCPTTLPDLTVRAMLHQRYLVRDEVGALLPGPRLLWQTGRRTSPS